MGDIRSRELDFRPFSDEVSKSLRLNSDAGDIPNVMAHELESPLGDDHDLVVSEVVQEHPGCYQHDVQKLLNLGVANFGVGEDLTDEVHWLLDL